MHTQLSSDSQHILKLSDQNYSRPEFNSQKADQKGAAAASFPTGQRQVSFHQSTEYIPEPPFDFGYPEQRITVDEQTELDTKLDRSIKKSEEYSQELSKKPEAAETAKQTALSAGARRKVRPLALSGNQGVPPGISALPEPGSHQETQHQIPTTAQDAQDAQDMLNLRKVFSQLGDVLTKMATDLPDTQTKNQTEERHIPQASSAPACIKPESAEDQSSFTVINEQSETGKLSQNEAPQPPVVITEQDLREMEKDLISIINDLPDPKIELSKKEKTLVTLAKNALSVLKEIESDSHGKLQCKSPCQVAGVLCSEVLPCMIFYIGATINLAAFVGTASDEDKLKNLFLALGASLATGPLYLKGFLAFLDKISQHSKASQDSGNSALGRLAKKISPWFNDPVKAMKALSFSGIAGMSVYLDAKNAANGINRLSGIPALGTTFGIFNGITEAFLPMFQLDETWKCIADPFTSLIRGSIHSKAELTTIAKSLTPLVERTSSQALKTYLKSLPDGERQKIQTLMNQLGKDEKKLTTELSRHIAGQPISSNNSRTYSLLMFMLQATAISATGILVAGAMSIPEKAGYYDDQLARCETKVIPTELYFNSTSDGTAPPFDLCQIKQYPLTQNTLNHLSYFMMSLGLYPCFLNSIETAKKTVSMAVDLLWHGKWPSLREVSSVGLAALSAVCYALIILGVRNAVDYVKDVEESNGFDTSLIEINDAFLGITITTIILTLLGGSEAGITAILDRAEKRLFDKTIKENDAP